MIPDGSLGRLFLCWGKTVRGTSDYHPALFHMLDVGHVAQELLGPEASPRWRRLLAKPFGAEDTTLDRWIPGLASPHDIGKISASFQGSTRAGQKDRLLKEGFSFNPWRQALDLPHPIISQVFIADGQLPTGNSLPNPLREVSAEMTGGHHGRFATKEDVNLARSTLKTYEPKEWADLRRAAAQILFTHFLVSPATDWPIPDNISTAIMVLTGFTILCDWLGSNSLYFPAQSGYSLEEYIPESRHRARQAVEASGFFSACSSTAPTSFAVLFADKRPPRPLQEAIDRIPDDLLARPCLAIIEAPTGEGKTEAALALAHRLARYSGTDELYYALPTTATSNQMFGRVQKHLRERLGLPPYVKLVHSQAFLVEDDLQIEPLANGDDESQDSMEWFGPKKRALLAPFGVGTIDQAELAALNVKHTALRMVGLAGKVVIFDEVHAYDTYMTTIVERLLHWLSTLGVSVIILSATLPKTRRAALARAYGIPGEAGLQELEIYPSLWVGNQLGRYTDAPPPRQPSRQVEVDFLHLGEDGAEAKARWLLEAIDKGGCVCWMANTVKRAQDIFDWLDRLAPPGVDRMLLHAQFPLEERQGLEEELTGKYGPDGKRPARGIAIGTQVLEQSLDLDFDLLVSDLAPVDLLLQREGRMHRHLERVRPPAHDRPRLWINAQVNSDGDLIVGVDRHVYAEFVLRQTWEVLGGRRAINLPADYRQLVEAVYGAPPPDPASPLCKSWQALQQKDAEATAEARQRLLPEPAADRFLVSTIRLQFEENEDSAAWIVGKTRLGEETVTVIPLERVGNKVYLSPDEPGLDLDTAIPRDVQLRLLRRHMRLSQQDVLRAIRASRDPLPRLFAKSALLKGYLPLWLSQGKAQLRTERGVLLLSLHPKLGLVIKREKGG